LNNYYLKNLKQELMKKFKTLKGHLKSAPTKTTADGAVILNLERIPEDEVVKNLPGVSIITITKNRGFFAGMMLHNWVNIQYPRDKLEWVIVDDSDDLTYNLRDYIPYDDPAINYVKLSAQGWKIHEKRNKAVELAKYDYIVHMDDDDYYCPDSVLAKVRLMLQYKCRGVLSAPIATHNMITGENFFVGKVDSQGRYSNDNLSVASFAYLKEYWHYHKFDSDQDDGSNEGKAFIGKRFDAWMNLNYQFNLIAIEHTQNVLKHEKDTKFPIKLELQAMLPNGFKQQMENVKKFLNMKK